MTFTGAGGTTCTYTPATQVMIINGSAAGSEWYVQGNSAATIPADVKDGDT